MIIQGKWLLSEEEHPQLENISQKKKENWDEANASN